jgi:hypothetical protein
MRKQSQRERCFLRTAISRVNAWLYLLWYPDGLELVDTLGGSNQIYEMWVMRRKISGCCGRCCRLRCRVAVARSCS